MQYGGKNILLIDLGGTNLRAAFGSRDGIDLDAIQKIYQINRHIVFGVHVILIILLYIYQKVYMLIK